MNIDSKSASLCREEAFRVSNRARNSTNSVTELELFWHRHTYTYIRISLLFIFRFLCMFESLSFHTRTFNSQFYNIYHHNDAQLPTDILEDCHSKNSDGQNSSSGINQQSYEEERRGEKRKVRTSKGFMHDKKKPLSKALKNHVFK